MLSFICKKKNYEFDYWQIIRYNSSMAEFERGKFTDRAPKAPMGESLGPKDNGNGITSIPPRVDYLEALNAHQRRISGDPHMDSDIQQISAMQRDGASIPDAYRDEIKQYPVTDIHDIVNLPEVTHEGNEEITEDYINQIVAADGTTSSNRAEDKTLPQTRETEESNTQQVGATDTTEKRQEVSKIVISNEIFEDSDSSITGTVLGLGPTDSTNQDSTSEQQTFSAETQASIEEALQKTADFETDGKAVDCFAFGMLLGGGELSATDKEGYRENNLENDHRLHYTVPTNGEFQDYVDKLPEMHPLGLSIRDSEGGEKITHVIVKLPQQEGEHARYVGKLGADGKVIVTDLDSISKFYGTNVVGPFSHASTRRRDTGEEIFSFNDDSAKTPLD